MSTLQTLQDILVKDYRVPREQITPDALLTTMGLDSLSVLELMFKKNASAEASPVQVSA